ncbi:MAG: MazG family protein, partial [Syntrophomonadaceae bacterium]|nr:MazG family protein [Syntrophomonadaceae bacterium]
MKRIIVVGLGPGGRSGLTLRAWEVLSTARRIFLRTAVHPLVNELTARGIRFTAFDFWYERAATFEEAYQGMAETLLAELENDGDPNAELVFAVPGHPLVAEQAVHLLLERLPAEAVEIVPGLSAVEAVCGALRLDPGRGLCLLDGLALDKVGPDPRVDNLIFQVYNRLVASEVKMRLMEVYPDDFPIKVIRAAGVPGEEMVFNLPLFELDRLPVIDHLTSVYLPPQANFAVPGPRGSLDSLLRVMDRLLSPQGCPWDREQTHQTLRPYLIEETYEVIEALDEQDMEKLEEELGDLLLQIVFHAALAERNEYFDINDVILKITQKMINRHPHVFGGTRLGSSGEVLASWEEIKRREGKPTR